MLILFDGILIVQIGDSGQRISEWLEKFRIEVTLDNERRDDLIIGVKVTQH